MAQRIGIDTGGTFTDFVLVDAESGEMRTAKVPSTPSEPRRAVENGLRKLADGGAFDVERLVVGSTVATNSVIERRGPRLFFVTNEGFTDVPSRAVFSHDGQRAFVGDFTGKVRVWALKDNRPVGELTTNPE